MFILSPFEKGETMKVLTLLTAMLAMACSTGNSTAPEKNETPPPTVTFMPVNDLHLDDDVMRLADITKEEFDAIIQKAEDYYRPIYRTNGYTLQVNRRWTDPTVNASATVRGTIAEVNMYGGFARRQEITSDAFALVVCHEFGHHLAGFPRYGNMGWAANEGQSDYFSTLSCSRYLWENELFTFIPEEMEPVAEGKDPIQTDPEQGEPDPSDPVHVQICKEAWDTLKSRSVCIRQLLASKSVATLLAVLGRETMPDFDTPDQSTVRKTQDSHPRAQCRLDTMVAGAVCPKDWNHNSISNSEIESMDSTCFRSEGFTIQARPRCWYAP